MLLICIVLDSVLFRNAQRRGKTMNTMKSGSQQNEKKTEKSKKNVSNSAIINPALLLRKVGYFINLGVVR